MVRFRLIILKFFLLFFSASIFADEVVMTANIENNSGIANQPLKGMITISHPPQLKVDSNSFSIQGKPLKVELVKQSQIEGTQQIAIDIYRFALAAQPADLYLLPAISVKIGDKIFASTPSSYQVVGPSSSTKSNSVEGSADQKPVVPTLILESFYDGPKPFYPGQRAKLGYRIYFNLNVEMTKEDFPLLKETDFLNIGDKQINEAQNDQYSGQQITQEIEANKIGTFTYGTARIEGKAYQENELGGRQYYKDLLHAEAPGLTVVVSPFPTEGQPASFEGAVGQFTFNVNLKSSPDVFVGDSINLESIVTGEGNLSSLSLPDISCQPGFSGFFDLDESFTAGEIEDESKVFKMVIRPISPFLTQIPPIEFSYFDPRQAKYISLRSAAIPITIKHMDAQGNAQTSDKDISQESISDGPWRDLLKTLPPIEIKSNLILKENDLIPSAFSTYYVLYLIPIGLALIILQLLLRRFIR